MPAYHFFSPTPFEKKEQIIFLSEEEQKHVYVMRLKLHDTLFLFNGEGDLAEAIITELSLKKVAVSLQKITHHKKPKKEIHLYLGHEKPQRLEYVLEKAVELGVSSFQFIPLEKSEVKNLSSKENRYHRQIIAALKQSGRLFFPKIVFHSSLYTLELPKENAFFADLEASKGKKISDYIFSNTEKVHLFIGPEGGFIEKEKNFLIKQGLKSFSLGNFTLRADTAAIVAIAQANLIMF